MTDYVWKWYVGSNEEEFHTTCDTRCEAVQIALEYGGAWIVEAAKVADIKLSAYFDADRFFDEANDCACDLQGPDMDPMFDVAPEQGNDLEFAVRAAIDEWQAKHGLKFVPWAFSQTRNLEYVTGILDEATE